VHTYKYIYIHTYVYLCIHVYIYTYICIHSLHVAICSSFVSWLASAHIYTHSLSHTHSLLARTFYIRSFMHTYVCNSNVAMIYARCVHLNHDAEKSTYIIQKNPHTYVHVYTFTRKDVQTYTEKIMHTYIHTYLQTYIRTYIRTYENYANIHACIHTYMHANKHIYPTTHLMKLEPYTVCHRYHVALVACTHACINYSQKSDVASEKVLTAQHILSSLNMHVYICRYIHI